MNWCCELCIGIDWIIVHIRGPPHFSITMGLRCPNIQLFVGHMIVEI